MSTEENGGRSGSAWRVFEVFCFIVGDHLWKEKRRTNASWISYVIINPLRYDLGFDTTPIVSGGLYIYINI